MVANAVAIAAKITSKGAVVTIERVANFLLVENKLRGALQEAIHDPRAFFIH